ncbi:hypothetical protein D3C87_1841200 [compost metagenome]
MGQGTEDAQLPGIGNQPVQHAPALEDRRSEPVDGVAIAQVERHQRGRRAQVLDFVIEFLEPAHGAGYGHHMGAAPGRLDGGGIADAPRGAGDEDDLAGQILAGSILCSSSH